MRPRREQGALSWVLQLDQWELMRLPGATLIEWWGSLALRKPEHCVGSGAERFVAWMQHGTPGPIEQNAWLYVRFVIIVASHL